MRKHTEPRGLNPMPTFGNDPRGEDPRPPKRRTAPKPEPEIESLRLLDGEATVDGDPTRWGKNRNAATRKQRQEQAVLSKGRVYAATSFDMDMLISIAHHRQRW